MHVLPILVSTLLAATHPPAEIAVFLGARGGATLDATSTGGPGAEADPAGSWGLSYAWWVRPDGWFEVLFDRQTLAFEPEPNSAIEPFDLTVDYLQFGGGYEPPREGLRPYVAAALGLSRFGSEPGSVRESTGLSGSIGAGFKVPMGARALFRLEARGWAAFTSDSAAVFCGEGCSFAFSGNGWWQLGVRAAVCFPLGGGR